MTFVDVAERLAWMPFSNLGGRKAVVYEARLEAHRALVEALRHAPRRGTPELGDVIRAARVVALCSFSNRRGLPYYARRQAMLELRGAIDAYRRAVAA